MADMEHVISQLERGTVVTKFFQKKHPDRRMLAVKKETRQVVWYKPMCKRNDYEGAGEYHLLLALIFFLVRYNVDNTFAIKNK